MCRRHEKYTGLFAGIILILILISVSGCSFNSKQGEFISVKRTDYLMGTLVEARVYAPSGEKGEIILDRIFKRMKEIEEKMSLNIEQSEINIVNNSAGENKVAVSSDTWQVVVKGLKYAELTNGCFDLSVGPLVKLWNIGTEKERVPGIDEIKEVLPLVNFEMVHIYPEERQILLGREGMMLDVGGIAKGYAADLSRELFVNAGIQHAFVNIGGNVLVLGSKPDGSPWRIGIQNPFKPRGAYMAVVEIEDMTVVTSGDYERYFIKDGKRYHHILDPRTGYPAQTGLKSVTIIGKSSLNADALSTGIFVLGLEEGLSLLEEIEGFEGILITEDKKVYLSSGLKGRVKITDTNFSLAN